MVSEIHKKQALDLIKSHKFFMLSKSWCPDCHYVYKVWDTYGVKSKVYILELDKMDDQTEAQKLEEAFTEISGRKWVPTIFFNGKKFGTEQDLKALEKDGKLEDQFKAVGLLD